MKPKEHYLYDCNDIKQSLYDELDGATREMSNPDQETLVRNYYLLEEWDRDDGR